MPLMLSILKKERPITDGCYERIPGGDGCGLVFEGSKNEMIKMAVIIERSFTESY